jgi:two-component system chemotaxis response regulator CheY
MLDLKILIADDLALIRSLIRKSLADLKLTNVEEAVDGLDAISKILQSQKQSQPYDVVFIDWNMPGKDGLEVVQYCKNDPVLKVIPFIMISAERDKVRVVQALKAGVLDYIVKPFQPSLLISKLERISLKRAG